MCSAPKCGPGMAAAARPAGRRSRPRGGSGGRTPLPTDRPVVPTRPSRAAGPPGSSGAARDGARRTLLFCLQPRRTGRASPRQAGQDHAEDDRRGSLQGLGPPMPRCVFACCVLCRGGCRGAQSAGDRLNPRVGCHQHLLPFIGCASKIQGHAPPTPAEMKAVSDCVDTYHGVEKTGTPLALSNQPSRTHARTSNQPSRTHARTCNQPSRTRARTCTSHKHNTTHHQVMMIFSMIDEDENGVIDQSGICICICICICMCICIVWYSTCRTQMHTRARISSLTCHMTRATACVNARVRAHASAPELSRACARAHIHTYTHIQIHARTHSHILKHLRIHNTHTHARTLSLSLSLSHTHALEHTHTFRNAFIGGVPV